MKLEQKIKKKRSVISGTFTLAFSRFEFLFDRFFRPRNDDHFLPASSLSSVGRKNCRKSRLHHEISLLTCFGASFSQRRWHAQVPQIINYQGRVAVRLGNFNGTGQFKFALVNGTGTTTYWSNNGTSVNGSEPSAAVPLTVVQGLYSVLLGNTALSEHDRDGSPRRVRQPGCPAARVV